jgi:hypothetical protein
MQPTPLSITVLPEIAAEQARWAAALKAGPWTRPARVVWRAKVNSTTL